MGEKFYPNGREKEEGYQKSSFGWVKVVFHLNIISYSYI
tara:strand:- start:27 stop:143 length:117 start_codon:yes stop_codon:yes gene_type:complete